MAGSRSFTEYIKNTFYNQFFAVAEEYLRENFDPLDMTLYKVHKAGEPEVTDVQVEHVWVEDLPDVNVNPKMLLSNVS